MRLVIVSHTPHYHKGESIVGWGATVREINALATKMDSIVHIAPLHHESPPESSLPYQSSKISLSAVTPSGGKGLLKKLGTLLKIPDYIFTMLREFSKADVIHVRCPAGISLIAIVLLSVTFYKAKRWVKYAGNWKPKEKESFSYSIQRWWLSRNFHRGCVSANGEWIDQEKHIHSFLNPCLTEEEWLAAKSASENKELSKPIKILFAGRLDREKGVERLLEIMALLKKNGILVMLDLVGDGDEKDFFVKKAEELGVADQVFFHGWLQRCDLDSLYSKAHLFILPSLSSEGWPKVLGEAMAFGVVPIVSNISSLPFYLNKFEVGKTFEATDTHAFAQSIESYISSPTNWKKESMMCAEVASHFTYQKYLSKVCKMINSL